MKKLIAVPVVAVIAAVGAASAAGFAGGVSAAPIQSGDAGDLQCAHSASVVEWGHNDHTNPPYVDTALGQAHRLRVPGPGRVAHRAQPRRHGAGSLRFRASGTRTWPRVTSTSVWRT